jgi:predicted transcriptional regulator
LLVRHDHAALLAGGRSAYEDEMSQKPQSLRIGIASVNAIRQRTNDIAAGRRKRAPNEPKVWFTSINSLAEVLSEPNRLLLEAIRTAQPATMNELAERTGRTAGNLSRTLRKMEAYGLVRLERTSRSVRPVVDWNRLDVEVPLSVTAG